MILLEILVFDMIDDVPPTSTQLPPTIVLSVRLKSSENVHVCPNPKFTAQKSAIKKGSDFINVIFFIIFRFYAIPSLSLVLQIWFFIFFYN